MWMLIWDGWWVLLMVVFVGFGCGIGEVGVIMIVGGNIDYVMWVLIMVIVLEIGKGDFVFVFGLGFVLIFFVIIVNLLIYSFS